MKTSQKTNLKKSSHYTIKNAITIFSLLLFLTNTSFSQNSWKGGTPGAETDWNNPKNWSENQVPDWSDEMVIIADISSQSGFFPQITNAVPHIQHLRLEGGATLTVAEKGKLIINGASTYNYGIVNVGKLINFGFVSIENTGLEPLENPANNIDNRGSFALIDYTHDIKYLARNTNQ